MLRLVPTCSLSSELQLWSLQGSESVEKKVDSKDVLNKLTEKKVQTSSVTESDVISFLNHRKMQKKSTSPLVESALKADAGEVRFLKQACITESWVSLVGGGGRQIGIARTYQRSRPSSPMTTIQQ